MKYSAINYWLFLVSIFLSAGVYGAESELSSLLASIQPFSKPFSYVPQYVYENCNQHTSHTWSKKYFETLRSSVDTVTKDSIKITYPDEKKFVTAAETYDWIYGLKLLESKFLTHRAPLSIIDLQKINARLSRIIADNNGDFRTETPWWPKKDLTPTELAFIAYTALDIDKFLHNQDPHLPYNPKTQEISMNDLLELAAVANERKDVFLDKDNNPVTVDLNEIKTWEAGSAHLSNHTAGNMNVFVWGENRMHYFPSAELVEPLLLHMLLKINSPQLHPIQAACCAWYNIVKIHPWHEANKRTGKATASKILLENGYLPPRITGADEKPYVKALQDGFEKSDGETEFTRFIAGLIVKTQDEFKGQTLD